MQICISIARQTNGLEAVQKLTSYRITNEELDQAIVISEIIKNCTNMPNRRQFLFLYMSGARI
ncbi:MAG: hypothetical protein LBJ03_02885 [Holosporales bacterium]|nr:hypothetical protein [Holosporales bacterium]